MGSGTLEILTANMGISTRRATLQGREYFVAPMTMIVPGILSGSKGALYYPSDEVSKNPGRWDHTPIVMYHPTRNGQNVSAKDKGILDESGVGFVQKSTFNGKLIAEGWFDIERVQAYDRKLADAHKVWPRLEQHRQIELSTGLFTDNEPNLNGDTFNGKGYEYIARNYRPDHLAILPDQIGACSVNDGCGVLVNSQKFQRPENYDKIRDVKGGKELWAGGNDWESGWTWAGTHDGSRDKDGYITDPGEWVNISHKKCPGCQGDLNAGSREDKRACQDFAKAQVEKWLETTVNHEGKFDHCPDSTTNKANFESEKQRRYMWSEHPEIAKKWAHGQHSSEGPDHKMPAGPGKSVKGPDAAEARKAKKKPVGNEDDDEEEYSTNCVLNTEGVCENCGGRGGKPGPCPRTKAAEKAVTSTSKKLAAAKAKVKALTAQLKQNKASLKQLKTQVKGAVAKGADHSGLAKDLGEFKKQVDSLVGDRKNDSTINDIDTKARQRVDSFAKTAKASDVIRAAKEIVGVQVRSKRDAVMELAGHAAESHRIHQSQRV